MTTNQAAIQIGMSKSFLDKSRVTGAGPSYYKVGNRVRYSEDELVRWMREKLKVSTSEM
tara:strand:+ start:5756 stop:5932 length:177 start_codon:yes stop_codon:yes gene_type:complete